MMIHLIAEGNTEEIVASKLLPFCGHELGTVYGKKGCGFIHKKAVAFHYLATKNNGVLVLTDFRDTKQDCILTAIHEHVLARRPNPPETFLFRFAVNEMESWLMADRKGMANYLGIALSRIPLQPENELFPKKALVNLARVSQKRYIREGMPPYSGQKASEGLEYMNCLREFITGFWDIKEAMQCAPSLRRCVQRLRELE